MVSEIVPSEGGETHFCLLHHATPYDTAKERRVMRRCTVLGDEPQGENP